MIRDFVRASIEYLALKQTYHLGIAALASFNITLVLFALVPLIPPLEENPLRLTEIGVAASSGIAIIGMFMHLFGSRMFLARWAFLISAFSSLLTVVGFTIGEDIRFSVRVLSFFFIMTGLLSAAVLHIEYGSDDPIKKEPDRDIC